MRQQLPERRGAAPHLGREDGVTIIHVAIALLVLLGFHIFVIDHGFMWLARRQAQNAADAGALAGAVARAYDETAHPPSSNGRAFQAAAAATLLNPVLGESPGFNVSWQCPAFAAGGRCVRVDAHRDGTNGGNAVPMFFARMFSVNTQPVRATATAWAAAGDTVRCLRPFAISDKWTEQFAPATDFNRWTKGPTLLSPNPDIYIPPSASSTGTSYRLPDDYGVQVAIKEDIGGSASWYMPVRLPDGSGGYNSGAADYRDAIETCIDVPVSLGQYLPVENGNMVGPTQAGVENLIALDAGAYWDSTTQTIQGSCAPGCAAISPRIVPVAVYDIDEFQWRESGGGYSTPWVPGVNGPGGPGSGSFSCPTGVRCVRIANILGLFFEAVSGNGNNQQVIGRIINYPGESTGGPIDPNASFLKVIQIVR